MPHYFIKSSVDLDLDRTIPTERPPLVAEINADFYGERVPRSQRGGSSTAEISVF
jgi:hypothetical protein